MLSAARGDKYSQTGGVQQTEIKISLFRWSADFVSEKLLSSSPPVLPTYSGMKP
jgi:hypothetical protein